jgi:hypothetical protein
MLDLCATLLYFAHRRAPFASRTRLDLLRNTKRYIGARWGESSVERAMNRLDIEGLLPGS